MRHFLLEVFLVVACATVAAAGSIGEAKSAFGRGDYAMAAQIFRSLTEQGEALAQNNLGGMYTQGLGVPKDLIRAHMWFTVTAAALSEDAGRAAMKNRDHVASQMTAAQIEKAQEMVWRCQQSKFKECD